MVFGRVGPKNILAMGYVGQPRTICRKREAQEKPVNGIVGSCWFSDDIRDMMVRGLTSCLRFCSEGADAVLADLRGCEVSRKRCNTDIVIVWLPTYRN